MTENKGGEYSHESPHHQQGFYSSLKTRRPYFSSAYQRLPLMVPHLWKKNILLCPGSLMKSTWLNQSHIPNKRQIQERNQFLLIQSQCTFFYTDWSRCYKSLANSYQCYPWQWKGNNERWASRKRKLMSHILFLLHFQGEEKWRWWAWKWLLSWLRQIKFWSAK